jgi:sigma-E factor negative regulatory protein RseB
MRLFPAILPDDIGNIAQSYTLKQRQGPGGTAGLQLADLKPRDSKRYACACVEPVSNLPLKVITQNAAGDAVEQFTFTEVELQGPKDKSASGRNTSRTMYCAVPMRRR